MKAAEEKTGTIYLGSTTRKADGNYVDIYKDGRWMMSYNFGSNYGAAVTYAAYLQDGMVH